MINVKIVRNTEGLISSYEIKGHADYAQAGFDIVCAAVSALTQAAANGLSEHLKREVDCFCIDGELKVNLTQAPDDLTEAVLATMLMALQDIAEQYPKRVRIQERRR